MSNVDNLNFKVILDDTDFNNRIRKDIKNAQNLNIQLSKLLQVKANLTKISAQDAANAKRHSDILTTQAVNQEKIRKASALTAEAEEKVRTQAAKTAKELNRAQEAAALAALAQQKLATESQKTAAATNQAAVNAQRLRTETQRTATEIQRTATATNNNSASAARAQLAWRRLRDYSSQTTSALRSQSRILNELKGYALGYLSVHGASRILSSLVRVTGEFELQKTTLAAMLGDLNSAEQVIAKIKGLAVESPFQFKELATYAKQLSAFSVPAQELYDTTKMLADISAGLGVGMDRIVLAYGQVRSAAFLRGQEVRQFTEAGIPILDELAKQFTELEGRAVSAGEVFDKISKRLVPFEMVAKVFKDMTSEGGKFYNMQEVQAETLKGKISNLKDAYEMMLNEIGQGQSENLKGAVDWARKLMTNYEDTGKAILELVAAYGAYKAVLLVVSNIQPTILRNLVVLRREFRALTAVLSANPYAVLAAGLTAVGFGMYKAVTHMEAYEKVQKAVTDASEDYTAEIHKEAAELDVLYAKLRVAKEGTEEYESARNKIYSQYSSYIAELKEEGKSVENLAALYNDLKLKIEDAAKSRFRISALQNVEEEYATGMDKFYKRFELLAKNMGNAIKRELMPVEKEALWQYLLGNENALNIPEAEGIRPIATDMGSGGYGYLVERAKKEAKTLINTYSDAREQIEALFGKEKQITSATSSFIYDLNQEESGKSAAQKAIEEQIKSIQKLKDAYEKLMPYLDEMQMKSTLKDLFPNIGVGIIDSLDFNAELEKLADRLAEFDEDAAQRLRDTVSKDIAGSIAESFKVVEQYKKMLDSWMGEDFDIMGEGTAFDISKILTNLNTEYSKIDQKRKNALDLLHKAQIGDEIALAKVREVYGEEVWEKYLEKGEQVINELATKEAAAARATANEKIRDLADKDLKERMEKANINLSDFDDKTIAQVEDAYNRLFALRNQLRNELEALKVDGVSEDEEANVQRLEEELKNLGVVIEDTGVELEKKLYDKAKSGMQAISDLGSSIENLGTAVGRSGITELGKNLSKAANLASELMEAFKAKDTIAIIANLASFAIEQFANIFTFAAEKQRVLTEATREYAEILLEIRREAYSGIFGSDEMALAIENQKILAEEQKKYQESLAKLAKSKTVRLTGSVSLTNVLNESALAEGWDLYRENGELNIDALESYFDVYSSRLSKKQRNLVTELIENGRALEEATDQSAEYITSVFSSAADTIAEKMVNAFIETGDAATDLKDVVSDIGQQMATDLIKTLYIMPVMNEYAEKLNDIMRNSQLTPEERTTATLGILEESIGKVQENEDMINNTLDKLSEYLGAGSESGTEMAEGIKGITEDQANLLASYLNAIRADVSFSKSLWIRMDDNLQRIADMLTSSPTLMEYQAQIAANTHDTAMASQAILSELRSVITTDSGDTAIRVNS